MRILSGVLFGLVPAALFVGMGALILAAGLVAGRELLDPSLAAKLLAAAPVYWLSPKGWCLCLSAAALMLAPASVREMVFYLYLLGLSWIGKAFLFGASFVLTLAAFELAGRWLLAGMAPGLGALMGQDRLALAGLVAAAGVAFMITRAAVEYFNERSVLRCELEEFSSVARRCWWS